MRPYLLWLRVLPSGRLIHVVMGVYRGDSKKPAQAGLFQRHFNDLIAVKCNVAATTLWFSQVISLERADLWRNSPGPKVHRYCAFQVIG